MAYDQNLAERISDYLELTPDVVERKMFGGIGFIIQGNMAVGVSKDSMMVRVGTIAYEAALSESGVRKFDMKGGEMTGWVLVDPSALTDDKSVSKWIDRGRAIALSLPPK